MKQFFYHNLISRHKDRIFNYASYFLGNRLDAEDITQDVFIKTWENLDSIRPGYGKIWMMKTARNLCIDHYRRKKTQNRYIQEVDTDFLQQQPDENTENPESMCDVKIKNDILLRTLDTLEPRYKNMIILRDIQGFSIDTWAQQREWNLLVRTREKDEEARIYYQVHQNQINNILVIHREHRDITCVEASGNFNKSVQAMLAEF